jgi:hypothetical protein
VWVLVTCITPGAVHAELLTCLFLWSPHFYQVEFEGSCTLKLQQLGEVYTISLPALHLLAPLADQGAAAFKGEHLCSLLWAGAAG